MSSAKLGFPHVVDVRVTMVAVFGDVAFTMGSVVSDQRQCLVTGMVATIPQSNREILYEYEVLSYEYCESLFRIADRLELEVATLVAAVKPIAIRWLTFRDPLRRGHESVYLVVVQHSSGLRHREGCVGIPPGDSMRLSVLFRRIVSQRRGRTARAAIPRASTDLVSLKTGLALRHALATPH